MITEKLKVEIEYIWESFLFNERHLTFLDHRDARLTQHDCSHWGAAVYMWKGMITKGPNSSKIGILIGETKDLRQRIKQYISGTQNAGNKYWRENFLALGPIQLHILKLLSGEIQSNSENSKISGNKSLSSNNIRLILEQLLVRNAYSESIVNKNIWIVNRKI